jgi:Domain of unknown function (DUF4397)
MGVKTTDMEFVSFSGGFFVFHFPATNPVPAGASKGPRSVRLRTFATIAAAMLGALAIPMVGPAQAQVGDARIRLAHFSPDANGVDVYIDGKKRMNRVPYQAVSDYITVPAGKHTIEVRGEGQAETSPALVSISPELAGNESFTAAALGSVANIQVKVFADDLAPPAPGKSKIRVIHAADGTPTVDIAVKDGDVLFPAVEFGSITTYVEAAAGPYVLQVRKAGDTAIAIEKPVTVQPGGIYTIAAVGGADKPPTLRGFVDLPAKSGTAAPTTAGTTSVKPSDTTPSDSKPAANPADSTPGVTKAGAKTPTTKAAVPTGTEVVPGTEPAVVEPVATIPPTKAPITPTTVAAAVGGGSSGGKTSTGKTPIGGTNDNTGGSSGGGNVAGGTGTKGSKGSTGTAVPVGGAKTGFGGMSDTSSALSVLAMGGAFMAMILSGIRRRNARA